ncbi:ATP-dependent zinc metalloprotease FtsH [Pseudobacteriovorax antillogorgiicola]|uniref:ATP-dependent zinc metalloprotease FtsH n=1 Tax=Pseudobacteriovorax antillogorgiicola TaxID=1513793 RepID=A0A1Y6CKR9_9BACT|nr:ATP-dependent zinc metalloprotease FtsH [Pseudobacteriovorax antillogorgiicola]TCS46163.1 cell division protease FtsH [Pseudobacteriovorax antillogorgiicola]SMF69908.1 cell division protease FtsH [Pseudobacteriovorax antillogorgiicola]
MSKSKKSNQQLKVSLMLAGLFMLFLMFNMMSAQRDEAQEVQYSEFKALVEQDKIEKVEIGERETIVTKKLGDTFSVTVPQETIKPEELVAKGISVSYKKAEEESVWKALLLNSLPLLLLLFLFFFFMRQLQIGGGKAMSFGKSRAKMLNENQSKLTFEDVAGIEEAKNELEEIVDFLKDPKKFTRLGGRIPKGVLLVGPPGTGKTILAKAIAGEAGVPFFSISGSDFVEMFVGVGASRVRDLFEQAKKQAPCIIFIDEIDAVGRQRGAGLGGGHDEREQTLNQLLVEMDGFETNEGVILIAATNRADVLDPALLRPGRFDRRVYVPKPDVRGRRGILAVHTRKTPLKKDVDLDIIAQGTSGFSGADLENLVNEAALIAARRDLKEVSMTHFESAKDKVLMGPERKSMIISESEKRNTAYHEAGHCIVAKMVPGADPVHKITIIPRGQALGVTVLLPTEDRLSMSKEYAQGMIAYAMGGRAAEEIVFGHTTTGAGNDIQKATDIARKMVCSWGMSDKLGPIALSGGDQEVFLGREWGHQETYSQQVLNDIDSEVKRIITEGYDTAVRILKEKRDVLTEMSESLLIRETLDSKAINAVMEGEKIITEEEKQAYQERIAKEKEAALAGVKSEDVATTPADEGQGKPSGVEPLPQGT